MVGVYLCLDVVKGLNQLFADNNHFRFNQVDAVFEYFALLGSIEHGAGYAELGGAGYHGQKLRAVFEKYGDGIAFGEPLVLKIAGDTVGPAIELAPGDRAVFK